MITPSSCMPEKYYASDQLLTLTVLPGECFKRKHYIEFDAELNGLHFNTIGFLEVSKGKTIWSKHWQDMDFGNMSET